MIIIHPLKIAFEDAPKVGSTSLFNWLYILLYGKKYEPVASSNKIKFVHGWMQAQQNEIIENQSTGSFKCPPDYLVFCLVRDPVKRLLSAYSNRVLHNNILDFSHKPAQKEPIKSGLLAARPTLNYFIEHLEDYQAIAPSIFHHTRPLGYFLGRDSSIYDYIFDVSEMGLLRQVLLNHWHTHKLLENQVIPEIPHLQTSGKKFFLKDLTESSFNKCLKVYADDYATFTGLNKNKISQEWQQSNSEHNKKEIRHTSKAIATKFRPEIAQACWLNKNKFDIHEGKIGRFSGVIILKSNISDNYQLVVSDARGEWQLKWKQPSPEIAKQYPNSPSALNARFNIEELHIDSDRPVTIFIKDNLGKTYVCFIISGDNQ